MENDTDRQKPIWKEGIQNILTRNWNGKECGQIQAEDNEILQALYFYMMRQKIITEMF